MVTYEEQLSRIQKTSDFIATSNDTSINNQNVLYRNLYDKCLSSSACNLDIFVAEHNLNPDKLDSSIINPIKYTTLREVVAQREILLDAGYKLSNFDMNNFDETKSIKSQISIVSSPNLNTPYFTPTKTNEVTNAFDYISGFNTTAQNIQKDSSVNFDGQRMTDPFLPFEKPEIKKAISTTTIGILAGSIAIGLGLVITSKGKK